MDHIKVFSAAMLVLVLLIVTSFLVRPQKLSLRVGDLVTQATVLHQTALQDNDANTSFQHSTEAIVHLQIARRLASDASILEEGIDAEDLLRTLTKQQALTRARLKK
jgi:hypothetical protein